MLLIITSTADELSGGINIIDTSRVPRQTGLVFIVVGGGRQTGFSKAPSKAFFYSELGVHFVGANRFG